MPHALNLTMKIKQDEQTLAKLAQVAERFEAEMQTPIDNALRGSRVVHSARVVVIDNLYLQVLTVYDGDHLEYTEFFRKQLPKVFEALFELAENPPPDGAMQSEDRFFEYAASLHKPSLGTTTRGELNPAGKPEGYLFSAFDRLEVKDILPKLEM